MGIIQNKKFKLNSGKKMDINVEFYTSAQDVVADCKSRTITDSSFDNKETECYSESFEGVKNYNEALELMKNGYQPTVDKLCGELKVKSKGGDKRIKFENNVHGFAPIVPLALKGVPTSMVNTTIKKMKYRVIDVYYDMTVNCGTKNTEIIANGQKVLGAIIALEKQGYKFNLYNVQTYYRGGSADVLCVKVKSSDKPLDLKRMSFPLTHPAFFRVIGFDWYSKCPVAKFRSGYGHALAYDLDADERKDFGEKMFGNNAIYISCANVSAESKESLQEVFSK